jgi:hypothetical protein
MRAYRKLLEGLSKLCDEVRRGWREEHEKSPSLEEQQAFGEALERLRRISERKRAIASAGDDTGTQDDHDRWLGVARTTLKQAEAEERQADIKNASKLAWGRPVTAQQDADRRTRVLEDMARSQTGPPLFASKEEVPGDHPPEPPMPRRREAILATKEKRKLEGRIDE